MSAYSLQCPYCAAEHDVPGSRAYHVLRRSITRKAHEERDAKYADEIVKLRLALNRIAYPATYDTAWVDPKEIARRALLIGVTIEPLPPRP